MDKAILKLTELKEALEKAVVLPSPKAPKMPSAPKLDGAPKIPKQPDLTPVSQKDPTKQAQQVQDPATKAQALDMAKEKLKLSKNGQWSLEQDPVEKGIKSTLTGAALIGSALFAPMKAAASPITPTNQVHDVLDHGNGEKSTLNTRSYGPYEVTTMLQPSSGVKGGEARASAELTHSVKFTGKAHNQEHAKALAAELKGSGIDHKQIMGLQAGDDLVSNKGKTATGPASKGTPSLWAK